MVAMLDADHSGMLGLEEFKILLNDIAKWKVRENLIKSSKIILTQNLTSGRLQTLRSRSYEQTELIPAS